MPLTIPNPSPTYASLVLSMGPAVYWPLDGADAADLTGAHDGTFTGGVTALAAVSPIPRTGGGAPTFNGTSGYVATSWDGVLSDNPVSVVSWVRTSATMSSGLNKGAIFGWGDATINGGKWHGRLNDDSSSGTMGALRIENQGGYDIGSTRLDDGDWHHSAFAFSGTNITDVIHYVDGVVDATSGSSTQTVNVLASHSVSIGSRFQNARDRWWDGEIAHVAVFDRALAADEIAALYFAGRNGLTGARTP